MESWPTFKSRRFSIGILGAITLGLKGLVYFLQKKRRMNSEIYINQVLKELRLSFFKRYMEEKRDMIWIDDGARYHTSKMTTKWCQKFGFLRMLWPTQSPDLNAIENLWHINKIRISAQRHRILEEMQKVI